MTGLAGKRALVTGSTRGIGHAIAMQFAAAGARVAVHGRAPGDRAQRVLDELAGDGHGTVFADLARAGAGHALVNDSAALLGGLDIVVNNAGVFLPHPVTACSNTQWQAAWRDTLTINLVAAADVCHAAAALMCESGGGRIINVTSRGAFRGEPDAPAYGASKAGLNAMSQSLAVALAPHGILVAAVAPGFIETDMAAETLAGPLGDAVRAQSPLGRVGRAEEVARTVLFLAQDDVEFATGAIIDLNGASYLR